MQTTPQLPPLAEYLDPSEVQQSLKQHYPSKQSFAWFVRRNREQLVSAGALIIIAGRMKFHPGLTERVVLDVGHRAALDAPL